MDILRKEEVVNAFLQKLKEDLETLLATIRENKKSSVEAPGAMQSHSDTSKFQFEKLVEADIERGGMLSGTIDVVERTKTQIYDHADVGALISAEEREAISYFYISPEGGGGYKLMVGDTPVFAVSLSSAVGRSFSGKKPGDEVTLTAPGAERTLKIVRVE